MSISDMKFDHKKPRMSIAPLDCLDQVAWIATYGAEKYEPRSWKQVKNGEERYVDALLRHSVAHAAGEILDPETGLPHMAQVAWNALAVLWFLRERGAIPTSYDFSGVRAKFEAKRAAAVSSPPPNLELCGACGMAVSPAETARARHGGPLPNGKTIEANRAWCPTHGGIPFPKSDPNPRHPKDSYDG